VTAYQLGGRVEQEFRFAAPSDLVALFYSSLGDLGVEEGPLACVTSTPSRGLLPSASTPFVLDRGALTWHSSTLPEELSSFRFATPPPKTTCATSWTATPIQLAATSSNASVVGAALIRPGVVWLSTLEPRIAPPTGQVIEIACDPSGGCTQKKALDQPKEGAILAMFVAPDGHLWTTTSSGCFLEWDVATATIASRTCGAPFSIGPDHSIDGPRATSTSAFELFATLQSLPFHYSNGALEQLPIPDKSDHVLWLGPGEAVFPSNAVNHDPSSNPAIWHRSSDGTISQEAPLPPEHVQMLRGARVVDGFVPLIATYPIGRQEQDLLVRETKGWALFATTNDIDHTIEALASFRGGVVYAGSSGKIGQISNGSDCPNLYTLGYSASFRILLDLALADESLFLAGHPNVVYRVTPM
jgi:hypothetical protein